VRTQQVTAGQKRTRQASLEGSAGSGGHNAERERAVPVEMNKRARNARRPERRVVEPAPRPTARNRGRDYRAGRYVHQPDVDPEIDGDHATSMEEVEVEELTPAPRARSPLRTHQFDRADEYLYDEDWRPLHDKHGRPLKLRKQYENMSNVTQDQDNRVPNPDGKPYRAKKSTRWQRDEGLFLYREVQKVPIGLYGQPTAYVYKRFHREAIFEGRTSNQIRDKMKDLVRQRRKNGLLVLGAARHYLPTTDPLYKEHMTEREAAQQRVTAKKRSEQSEEESEPNHTDSAEDEDEENKDEINKRDDVTSTSTSNGTQPPEAPTTVDDPADIEGETQAGHPRIGRRRGHEVEASGTTLGEAEQQGREAEERHRGEEKEEEEEEDDEREQEEGQDEEEEEDEIAVV
jgi:hypothetical protein